MDCSYRTNELIGEDGTVIIRLVPVQYNGLDDCVAAWGILMYHLDCCCSEHLPFWDCWLAAPCSRAFHDLRLHLPVIVCCYLFVRTVCKRKPAGN